MTLGFVLVHGGVQGAWSWERVAPLLNHSSVAVELPGRGTRPGSLADLHITDYVDAIVADAEASEFDEIVLVGHSLAGLLIPSAASLLGRRVRHLVFLSSMIARDGARAVDLAPGPLQRLVVAKLFRDRAAHRGFTVPPPLARWFFCQDLDPRRAADLLDRLCAEPPNLLLERLAPPALPADLPRTYLGFAQDRLIRPRMQRQMAASIDANWIGISGGHNALLSRPAPVAASLNDVAATCRTH